MLRHLPSLTVPPESSRIVRTDVLVLGGGVAGLCAAIAAGERADVLVVTKDAVELSNTAWAQGGVAAVLGDEDSVAAHRDDTISVGAGLCDPQTVEVVVSEGAERIRDLIDWGGEFDRSGGRLHLGLEGGHSQKRIVHAQGDRTGLEVQKTLVRRAAGMPRIGVLEHGFVLDLIVEDGRCRGAVVHQGGSILVIRSRSTILATGGAGQLYRETTNPKIATGDGLAMCARAGVALRDMEFIQFHPTTLYVAGSARHLVTEAVRGEGGRLRDMSGERFMVNYHPSAELAPRDVVSRSIVRHLASTGDSHVFLDLSHLDADLVRRRFPQLVATCALYRIDATKDLIPVHPSAHYVMGGVEADLTAATALPGLFACGEVASSGLHGANRLASNSLLEGLVFGRRAGRAAVESTADTAGGLPLQRPEFSLEGSVINVPDMLNSIRSTMWRDVGIVRSGTGLKRAAQRLSEWSNYLFQCRFSDAAGWELVNVLTAAHAVAASALYRRESRGSHFRTDFPETDDAHWRRHTRYPTDLAETVS